MKRYVQNKYSSEATKWEVFRENGVGWYSRDEIILPKSEYVEVSAPEQWERCGPDSVVIVEGLANFLKVNGWDLTRLPSGYRWAWDRQEDGTLVIERKRTE